MMAKYTFSFWCLRVCIDDKIDVGFLKLPSFFFLVVCLLWQCSRNKPLPKQHGSQCLLVLCRQQLLM